jgi:DNA modification methylase
MIPERAVLMSTNPNDIVLDPFGGGGTTYQLAEKYKRYWICMEIGPREPIVERLQYFINANFGDPCNEKLKACFIHEINLAIAQNAATCSAHITRRRIAEKRTKLIKRRKK